LPTFLEGEADREIGSTELDRVASVATAKPGKES
jgi:hypothetical protein